MMPAGNKSKLIKKEIMTTKDILKLRDIGEASKIQFKERILDKYDIGCELVAMSNACGGNLSLVSTTRQELLIRCRMPKCRKLLIYSATWLRRMQ